MSEDSKLHRCCFTGHCPDKMELGKKEIISLLEKTINEAISKGYVTFITGMATGTDIRAAEIVLERKKYHRKIYKNTQKSDMIIFVCPNLWMGTIVLQKRKS